MLPYKFDHTCKIVVRQQALLLVQLRPTADVDLRIDDHVVILPRDLENFDLVVQADEDQGPGVEYRQVVPVVRGDVITQHSRDLRVVPEI